MKRILIAGEHTTLKPNPSLAKTCLLGIAVVSFLLVGCGRANGGGGASPAGTNSKTDAAAEQTGSAAPASGQTRFVAKPGNLKVRIEGTSTIHDWQMESPTIGGYLEASPEFPTDAKPGKVPAKVEAFIPVRSLKSIEKNGSPYSDKMNEIVWDKLLQEKYPRIMYRLGDLTLKEAPKANGGPYLFDSSGELVVAGATNKITMPVEITPGPNKSLHITGNTKVKMSDFKVEPPSPTGIGMLIKTGDEVKLLIDWTVQQKAAPAAAK